MHIRNILGEDSYRKYYKLKLSGGYMYEPIEDDLYPDSVFEYQWLVFAWDKISTIPSA